MDYNFQIVPEDSLRVETITGEITLQEMIVKTNAFFLTHVMRPVSQGFAIQEVLGHACLKWNFN